MPPTPVAEAQQTTTWKQQNSHRHS